MLAIRTPFLLARLFPTMRDLLVPPAADLDASPSAKVRVETKISETIVVSPGDALKAETLTLLHVKMETTIEVMAMCSAAIAVDREAVNVVGTAAAKEVAREEEPQDMTTKDTTTKVREIIAALAEITITITIMNVLRAVEDTILIMIIPARTTEEAQ